MNAYVVVKLQMWGVWDRAWAFKHGEIYFRLTVRGYHVYKVVWKPTIGEKLQLDQELGNEADKFAMKVVKNNGIVGNLPREYCTAPEMIPTPK